jgi:general L-amino acid transport system substrate-binding protein
MVRRGDEEWFNAVSWVIYGLIEAEEVGITQANIDHLKANSGASKAGRWLARANASGPQIGLSREWAYRALRTSGNYGEIFERNLGGKSPLRLPRGLNNLWSEGGMHYPIPFF